MPWFLEKINGDSSMLEVFRSCWHSGWPGQISNGLGLKAETQQQASSARKSEGNTSLQVRQCLTKTLLAVPAKPAAP